MKPTYRATCEELATLFWGDNPDALARHSLRQCLISLRQDLCLASEILSADREAISLRTQLLAVDARTFLSLARSGVPDELTRAVTLWYGAFLPVLTLDIEAFDVWHRQEAERLVTAAAAVFEALCRNADANGDGESAITAAEQLVALEPTREDRQRTALTLFARYRGREAALNRAKSVTDLLRQEIGVAPETATSALVDAIRQGNFERVQFERPHGPDQAQLAAQNVVLPAGLLAAAPLSLPAHESGVSPAPALSVCAALAAPRNTAPATLPFWHRRPRAAASAGTALLLVGAIAALGLANGWKLPVALIHPQQSQAIAVLPFVADNSGRSDSPPLPSPSPDDLIQRVSQPLQYATRGVRTDIGILSRAPDRRGEPQDGPRREIPDRRSRSGQRQRTAVRLSTGGYGDPDECLVRWPAAGRNNDPVRVADETARGVAQSLRSRSTDWAHDARAPSFAFTAYGR